METDQKIKLSKPAVALHFMQVMAGCLRQAEAHLEDLAFKSIPVRLAALLLHLCEEQGNNIGGYTPQDLAEAVGTYRETIPQTLNEFKAKGLIEIGRKRLDILDPIGLEGVAAE